MRAVSQFTHLNLERLPHPPAPAADRSRGRLQAAVLHTARPLRHFPRPVSRQRRRGRGRGRRRCAWLPVHTERSDGGPGERGGQAGHVRHCRQWPATGEQGACTVRVALMVWESPASLTRWCTQLHDFIAWGVELCTHQTSLAHCTAFPSASLPRQMCCSTCTFGALEVPPSPGRQAGTAAPPLSPNPRSPTAPRQPRRPLRPQSPPPSPPPPPPPAGTTPSFPPNYPAPPAAPDFPTPPEESAPHLPPPPPDSPSPAPDSPQLSSPPPPPDVPSGPASPAPTVPPILPPPGGPPRSPPSSPLDPLPPLAPSSLPPPDVPASSGPPSLELQSPLPPDVPASPVEPPPPSSQVASPPQLPAALQAPPAAPTRPRPCNADCDASPWRLQVEQVFIYAWHGPKGHPAMSCQL